MSMTSSSSSNKKVRHVPTGNRLQKETEEPRTVQPGTVGEFIAFLYRLPQGQAKDSWPEWPPDMFAISAYLLQHSGEYRRIVRPAVTYEAQVGAQLDWQEARKVGATWRIELDKEDKYVAPPDRFRATREGAAVIHWWDVVVSHSKLRVADIESEPELVQKLLKLLLAADECCKGVGVRRPVAVSGRPGGLCDEAEYYLANLNDGRSICLYVRPDSVCVLPKLHTPQVGLTLRSLTHNLALCRSSEVRAYWNMSPTPIRRRFTSLNLLLLPWPTKIHPTDFRVVPESDHDIGELAHNAVYQEFAPRREKAQSFAARVDRALRHARERSGEIHGLVFPEGSLDIAQYLAVEKVAWRHRVLLIAGVQEVTAKRRRNLVVVQPLGLMDLEVPGGGTKGLADRLNTYRAGQNKHHRWCLDRTQILQYELGGRLPASRRCWEYIHIGRRELNILSLGDWLTWCALVCEDLARQDPTAEIIRSVGPNLVVALLMDGPQLAKRWPGRYAAVLADDPGSSVLTLTNLGMARRSRPLQELGKPRNAEGTATVVALWNDRIYGMREIALSGQEDACVLNLVCHSEQEFTADAHPDDMQGHFVVYAGHVPFASDDTTGHGGPH
jgi:hypothetical protein